MHRRWEESYNIKVGHRNLFLCHNGELILLIEMYQCNISIIFRSCLNAQARYELDLPVPNRHNGDIKLCPEGSGFFCGYSEVSVYPTREHYLRLFFNLIQLMATDYIGKSRCR